MGKGEENFASREDRRNELQERRSRCIRICTMLVADMKNLAARPPLNVGREISRAGAGIATQYIRSLLDIRSYTKLAFSLPKLLIILRDCLYRGLLEKLIFGNITWEENL